MKVSPVNPNGIPLDQVLPAGLTMGQAIERMRTYAHEVEALEQVLSPERLEWVTDLADQWGCLPVEALERALAQTPKTAA